MTSPGKNPMECPKCGKVLTDRDVSLYSSGRNGNRCPECQSRIQLTAESSVLRVIVFVVSTGLSVGVTALVFGGLSFVTAHVSMGSFFESRGVAKVAMIPALVVSSIFAHRYFRQHARFQLVSPSIGRPLTVEERNLMRRHKVTYNEDWFSVKGIDFDRLDDAVAFAIAERSRLQ